MRVLHVIPSVDPSEGGPVEGIIQMQGPLYRAGVESNAVCCDSPDAPWIATSTVCNLIALGPARLGKYSYSSRLQPWLRAHALKYDAIIVHGLWQYAGFAVWRVFSGSTVPYFVFTHGMLDPWFRFQYPLKHLKKWLYWPWADYRLLRDARAVLFTSEEERLRARRSFWLYRANEAITGFGSGSPPLEVQELRKKFLDIFPVLNGKRVILFLGRISEKKGCDMLLDAFAEVSTRDSRLQLVIAGPDQTGWVAKLQAQADSWGIADRVTWPGMLSGESKWGAFFLAEVVCLPSHQENFGLTVSEALSCGKPVLISDKVNIWREIQIENAGFVDSDTVEGTTRSLVRWLGLSIEDRAAMGDRALATFENHFHANSAARRLLEILGVDIHVDADN